MNLNEYLVFVIEHKCNSKCGICFIEGSEEQLADLRKVSLPLFKKALDVIPKGMYSGIVFSGGEVTLSEELPEYAAYARDKGFDNIMIQTNARALSNYKKVQEFKAAGINHYFVSFHSADYDLSDKITGKSGAHAQTVKGLENLRDLGLTVFTNTVMSSLNYKVLPGVGEYLQTFKNIIGMHFWGYVPMTLQASELLLPYESAAPYLNQTIKYLLDHHRKICVKFFPVCLLDEPYKKFHDNRQPITFGIIDKFVDQRFEACDYKTYPCCGGSDCIGLPKMYRDTMAPDHWMSLKKINVGSKA